MVGIIVTGVIVTWLVGVIWQGVSNVIEVPSSKGKVWTEQEWLEDGGEW